jgi:hypothetical protein
MVGPRVAVPHEFSPTYLLAKHGLAPANVESYSAPKQMSFDSNDHSCPDIAFRRKYSAVLFSYYRLSRSISTPPPLPQTASDR